jgi:putative toxin-antitoxin system antitoxin component (TIGR02293 family)
VRITSPISLHESIRRGFPRNWVVHFIGNLDGLPVDESLKALNISSRTYHRIKSGEDKARMDADQSARLWNFGEVLARAEEILGSREAAREWLRKQAIGLEGHRPLDLMETPQGAEIVKTLLDRMAHGVYA